jgi:hypothetical protein
MIQSRKDGLGTETLSVPFRKEELETILEDIASWASRCMLYIIYKALAWRWVSTWAFSDGAKRINILMRNKMTDQGPVLGVLKAWPCMKIPWNYTDHFRGERACQERARRVLIILSSAKKCLSWCKSTPNSTSSPLPSNTHSPQVLRFCVFFCSSKLARFLLQLSLNLLYVAIPWMLSSAFAVPLRTAALVAPSYPEVLPSLRPKKRVTVSFLDPLRNSASHRLDLSWSWSRHDRLLHDTNCADSCPPRKILPLWYGQGWLLYAFALRCGVLLAYLTCYVALENVEVISSSNDSITILHYKACNGSTRALRTPFTLCMSDQFD